MQTGQCCGKSSELFFDLFQIGAAFAIHTFEVQMFKTLHLLHRAQIDDRRMPEIERFEACQRSQWFDVGDLRAITDAQHFQIFEACEWFQVRGRAAIKIELFELRERRKTFEVFDFCLVAVEAPECFDFGKQRHIVDLAFEFQVLELLHLQQWCEIKAGGDAL